MEKIVVVLCMLSIVVYGIDGAETSPGETLKLVHVFFRHGSRTPEKKDVYPTDPYTCETFQPMGYGQLTQQGENMAYKLGQILRERYDKFLGNIYMPNMIQANSTDYDRTKASTLLVLAGLFPPSCSQKWNNQVEWQPIPYNYKEDKYDFALRRPNSYCPAYMKELDAMLQSKEVTSFLKTHKDIIDFISKNTGKKLQTTKDVFGVFQTLTAENTMNLTLPEWTKEVYPEKITEIAVKQCESENKNVLLRRLNGGRSLQYVVQNLIAKSKGKLMPLNRKIYLFSGHENNVVNILAALGLFKPHFPNYSSAVIIELHYINEEKNYAVKVYYVRDIEHQPEEMVLDGCSALCPLNQFLKITANVIPTNYTAECESPYNLD